MTLPTSSTLSSGRQRGLFDCYGDPKGNDEILLNMLEINFAAGNSVLYSTNGQVGVITGKFDKFKDRWQVKFNGKDLIWVPGEKLSLVPGHRRVRPQWWGTSEDIGGSDPSGGVRVVE